MGMQEQLNQKSEDTIKATGKYLVKGIVASIKATSFGTAEFMTICKMIAREGTDKVRHNNISVARLTKMVDGRPGDSISKIDADMTEKATKSFKKYASKYGVKYSLVKDTSTVPPTYSVFFAAKDTSVINQCIKEYMKEKYREPKNKSWNQESIKERMKKAKEKMKHVNKDKEKTKERTEKER